MRKVIIQVFCVYLFLFYTIVGIITINHPMSKYLLLSGMLAFIVSMKMMMFKKKTNMFYNSMFLFISLIINYTLIKNFMVINLDAMSHYLFRTFPNFLKQAFVILNIGIVIVTLIDFLDSKTSN